MGAGHIVDNVHKRLYQIWSGTVTKQEVWDYAHRHLNDPTLRPPMKVLVDARHVYFEDAIGTPFIQEVCDLYLQYPYAWKQTKIAVVPGKEFDRVATYARVVTVSGLCTIAFNDLISACTWLDIPFREAQEALTQARASLK